MRLGSLEKWALAQRVFEAKMNQLGKTLKRNKQYDPFKELQKAHKAELAFVRAREEKTLAKLFAWEALLKLAEADTHATEETRAPHRLTSHVPAKCRPAC